MLKVPLVRLTTAMCGGIFFLIFRSKYFFGWVLDLQHSSLCVFVGGHEHRKIYIRGETADLICADAVVLLTRWLRVFSVDLLHLSWPFFGND